MVSRKTRQPALETKPAKEDRPHGLQSSFMEETLGFLRFTGSFLGSAQRAGDNPITGTCCDIIVNNLAEVVIVPSRVRKAIVICYA